MTFRGLTWDHPRGYDALAAAERRINAGRDQALISWDKQPLEGFESAPIADLAAAYDLVVLDHPHIGEAVAADCLVPLDDLYSRAQIAEWENQAIGAALSSYRWGGKTYALPLDVATQVMVRNGTVLADAPTSWPDILDHAGRLPVAQSLAGPHAFLTMISMAAGLGHWPRGEQLLPDDPALSVLETMATLYALRPPGSEQLNPIALLETMARDASIALVPLVFGYVTYVGSSFGNPLRFSNSLREMNGAGGVLGGTGIGFSKNCEPSPELLEHVAWLMQPAIQEGFIPAHGGQPSARVAWHSPAVNAAWSNFYLDTSSTAEHALLRPRFDGFIAFQTSAGRIIRDGLEGRRNPHRILELIRSKWTSARANARGDLDDDRGSSS